LFDGAITVPDNGDNVHALVKFGLGDLTTFGFNEEMKLELFILDRKMITVRISNPADNISSDDTSV